MKLSVVQHHPQLTRMALKFFDQALDATDGDDYEAAMLASATLMAALDRVQERAQLSSEAPAAPIP